VVASPGNHQEGGIMKYDAISEKLNDVAMDGGTTEEYGSCEVEGFWAGLVITDEMICDGEHPDLPLIGIIAEDSQGFVDYELCPTEKAAREKWTAHVDRWERLYEEEGLR
jgi:hypothetical protein